ncbi:DJ-1/PfpI family protein [Acidocella aminolytica]|jgi:putative intracellular protease/amidase|uniref:Transcriptional regulator AraC/glutamine amidotransferase n=1 Tax=Acidocella aminolytica 101 = DSM 11237 TaxID=1120923 RepID=A0A0D6PFC0_9PROT|nr:DJ-1/PfpI family protein [Acidocella aminolytica]GAN79554.1 transcriptional regulator AraC/glutamine amidotransferase [Acidocella aminolytica 101 = DSM 11237]GBQ39250.1 putative intracellular protease/amidase [Acidocella aminolytica 101 = DSM 11237]SHF28300.1 DJ-1/PfpI family protein [Acidocella aminolytica 101 = DSM 11237]
MTEHPFRIVFAIYPGMTHLDFTGPHQFLSRLPGSEVIIASPAGGDVLSEGLIFAGTKRLADIGACDLICVPGGASATAVALDTAFIAEVRRLGLAARYITSVCTGSLILGAAGLLAGRRAACHWAWRYLLPLFGAVPDDGRVVRDGNIMTGGGVTAGIDFALAVLAEIGGVELAQTVQLGLEYAPAPPFDAGRPETAPASSLAAFRGQMAYVQPRREAEVREAARRLGAGRA